MLPIRYFSMFSGIGGFEIGILNATQATWLQQWRDNQGLSYTEQSQLPSKSFCIGYSEIDKYATQIYEKHYKGHKNYGDCAKIKWENVGAFDMLVGGFPCPSFSIAGKRLAFNDERGQLFFEIIRCLKSKQPRFAVLENVKGILSAGKGAVMEKIVGSLFELGYYVNYDNYNSKNFGVPQNRERIFFLCTHLKEVAGQYQKIDILKKYIEQFLFGILLKNLTEAKKLQDQESKDWALGYLLLEEISQNQNLFAESTKAIITTAMEESKYPLVRVNLWQNIERLLQNEWEENYLGQSKFTISTAIKQIMSWETYSYSKMFLSICMLTVHLRNSSKHLWKEMLLTLILIKEGTKYARINKKAEKYTLSESNSLYLTEQLGDFSKCFLTGHLRGTRRPEIFPIGGENGKSCKILGRIEGINGHDYLKRCYSDDGLAPTLPTGAGGNHEAKIAISVLTPDRPKKRQNGRRFKTDGEPAFTQTAQDRHGVYDGCKIRRLTPTECERLQGFPDRWTEGISDTQRYKCLGNTITVNVVTEIMKRLLRVLNK